MEENLFEFARKYQYPIKIEFLFLTVDKSMLDLGKPACTKTLHVDFF